MAKLYQHQHEGTYYTRVYRGAIATLQIHPAGVDYLFQRRTFVNDDIASEDIRFLGDNNWLFTKDEVRGMGEVDWTYEGWKARQLLKPQAVPQIQSAQSKQSHAPRTEKARPGNENVVSLRTWCDKVIAVLRSNNEAITKKPASTSLRHFQDLDRSLKSSTGFDLWTTNQYIRSVDSLQEAIEFLSLAQLNCLSRLVSEVDSTSIGSPGFDLRQHLSQLKFIIEQQQRLRSNPPSRSSVSSHDQGRKRLDTADRHTQLAASSALPQEKKANQSKLSSHAHLTPPQLPPPIQKEPTRFAHLERTIAPSDANLSDNPVLSRTSNFAKKWWGPSSSRICLGIVVAIVIFVLYLIVQ